MGSPPQPDPDALEGAWHLALVAMLASCLPVAAVCLAPEAEALPYSPIKSDD